MLREGQKDNPIGGITMSGSRDNRDQKEDCMRSVQLLKWMADEQCRMIPPRHLIGTHASGEGRVLLHKDAPACEKQSKEAYEEMGRCVRMMRGGGE